MLILKKAFWRFKTTIKTIFWKFKTILKKIYWRLKKLIKVIKYYLNKTKAINTIKNSLDGIVFLSNIYPSYDNIYRNMFVHSRVKAFFNKGLVSNVIVVNPFKCFYLREYEGINIAEINSVILKQALKDIKGLTLCVHFLNRSIWDGVKDNLENNKLIIWVHGADIQPWWRRKFNYENNDVELKKEKKNSEKRMELWKEVFNHKYKENIHIVFVSEYSKNEAFEDYGVDWPNSNCSVIHNYINIDKFNYIKKPVEQRKKILTIKSFSAKTYANDITQKAIIELSKNKIFDDLEFAIYGDGARFEEDTQLLKNFKNVSINKKFLNSDEIAA
ncbi:MAG: hypothetical protein GYA87_03010, partial [Christensenellaceae bacterium]|nr:hypothetical protein [Christensenellaceae bacterium]